MEHMNDNDDKIREKAQEEAARNHKVAFLVSEVEGKWEKNAIRWNGKLLIFTLEKKMRRRK